MSKAFVNLVSSRLAAIVGPTEDIQVTRVLGLVSLVVIAAVSVQLLRTWWPLRHIPGPFLAKFTNLQRVWWVNTGRAHIYHQALHAKYGEVVRIGPHTVSVSNPEAITTIYPTRIGFPKSDFYATMRSYTRERGAMATVFTIQDEQMHKHLRGPIAQLYTLSNVVLFEGLVDEVIEVMAEQLDKRFAATGKMFDLQQWLRYFAFDVMGTMSYSKRYGFLDNGRDDGGLLDFVVQFLKTAAPISQMPWLDPLIYKNKFVHIFQRTPGMSIVTTAREAIRQRLEHIDNFKSEPVNKSGSRDFLSRFLEIQKSNSDVPPWAPTSWTFTNVIAGSDTVGSVMCTVICNPLTLVHASELHHQNNLCTHPAAFRKLLDELQAANLTQPYPKWNEVRELPYLDACVQESLRWHPPFALAFERVVPASGINVLGRYLPSGTAVGGNPYVVNRHVPTFGKDVEEWRPERWTEGGEVHKKKLEQSLLSFGAGRRVCLGKYIGLFEVKKLVPFLILNYDIHLEDPNTLHSDNGFFLHQSGVYCGVKRKEKQLI